MRYVVLDEAGKSLKEGSAQVSSTGLHIHTDQKNAPDRKSATLAAISEIGTFRSPEGPVQVRVEVGPDRIYHALVKGMEIRVHGNIPESGWAAGLLCVTSPVVFVAGFLLLIYGPFLITTRARSKRS